MPASKKCRTLKSDDQSSFWGFESGTETGEFSYVLKGGSLRRLYSTFAGGWPGADLLLMRVVVGSALLVRTVLRLWSDLPAMNVTIPALVLTGAGILLIVGLWTPIVGTFIAMIEIWKMLTLSGDKWVWLL
jgi:putative oxidoreductase